MKLKNANRYLNVEVEDGKVIKTLFINGTWKSNPTLEDANAAGWKEVEEQDEPTEEPTEGYYYAQTWTELPDKWVRSYVLTKIEEPEEWEAEDA